MVEGQVPTRDVEVLVVGAGPAGLTTAARLGELGVNGVVVLDREPQPGGLPAQCEHAGFGLWAFKRLMRGYDFAARLVARAERAGVKLHSDTTVLSISRTRELLAVSASGLERYRARALVLATGCREMPRSTLTVAGSRPAGIFNTGVVQRLDRFFHTAPGREAVIVGSDDMSLMATQSLGKLGVRVRAVVEERPYRQGYLGLEWLTLRRKRIPLLLRHHILEIQGRDRVSGVVVAPSDGSDGRKGEPFTIPCDTVIFSGEFFPENHLARQGNLSLDAHTHGPQVDQDFRTDAAGIFACGNLIHAADAADHAVEDGEQAAVAVQRHLQRGNAEPKMMQRIVPGDGVYAVVPQCLRGYDETMGETRLAVRVAHAQRGVRVVARSGGDTWGRGYTMVAKPHRSIYVGLSPKRLGSEPLIVSASGWDMVARKGNQNVSNTD